MLGGLDKYCQSNRQDNDLDCFATVIFRRLDWDAVRKFAASGPENFHDRHWFVSSAAFPTMSSCPCGVGLVPVVDRAARGGSFLVWLLTWIVSTLE